MTRAVLGIIGGSGLYDLPGLTDPQLASVSSPWGAPSDTPKTGRIGETEVVFIPRHGPGHRLSPSGINYRANIDVMKRLGVTDLVSLSACGSFKSELYPGLFVLVDQFVDLTKGRETSFFGNGCVGHVSMAQPVGPKLQELILAAAAAEEIACRHGGTYVCMEGPQFSSYAESLSYRALKYDLIGMTAMPEAKLAREAEITYATVGMVTDYDCWHPEHGAVDVAKIMAVLNRNAGAARALVTRLASLFPPERVVCPNGSHNALDFALVTAPAMRDPALMAKLDAVAGRVLARST